MKIRETLRKKAKGKKGFTLVELVIVIAVLAIIAAIAIPTVTNVIGNANAAADASNAQSIELAIKTAQAECAANVTHHSARADAVINDSGKKVSTLLSEYGVDTTSVGLVDGTNDKLKVSGHHFFYNPTNGKVVCADTATHAGTGFAAMSASNTYTAKDDDENPISGTSGPNNPLSAVIALS